MSQLIILHLNVRSLDNLQWLKERTNPGNEVLVLSYLLEEVDMLAILLVELMRELES